MPKLEKRIFFSLMAMPKLKIDEKFKASGCQSSKKTFFFYEWQSQTTSRNEKNSHRITGRKKATVIV
jgi:hypothetical protein